MNNVVGISELSSAEMAEHRNCVHAEARERISEVGGALRVGLNDLVVGSLREYIALSRHQLEMSEYVNVHTGGSDDPDDLWVNKIHWPTGQYYPYQVARRPVDENEKILPHVWAVEQLRDVMWRVKAVGGVLGRSGKHLVATDVAGLTELSNHQCEIADFMRTGKFKKVPRRRKARYLGGDGTQSAETARRVRELGEVLNEYQGRIEIKTVREFIALSKHQCELAGMVIASEREMKGNPVFEVVHYSDAYSLNGNGSFHHRDTVGTTRSREAQRKTGHIVTEYTEKKTNNNHPSFPGRLESPTTLTGENAKRADASEYEQRVPYIRKSERSEWLKSRGFDPSLCISDSVVNTSWQSLSLHGIIRHPTGKPAENIRVHLDMGDQDDIILSFDRITDREGRFAFEAGGDIRPPDTIIIRGELINRLSNGPLPDAEVNLTIGGVGGRGYSAITGHRGRFATGDGAPKARPPANPLWSEVESDDGPQFYTWDMGWDDDP
jgi:hypothetical protein